MSLTKKNLEEYEEVYGWGLYPRTKSIKKYPKNIDALRELLSNKPAIARGNGRSYGDSSFNKSNTIEMLNFNRFLDFNEKTGLVTAEAGVLLEDVIKIFLPRGWFPNVTPGSKFVTLGGMIAANVHGKNHHKKGSFSNYIKWIEIMDDKGKIIRCCRKKNHNLFKWTIGGMGLTGIILKVAFYLKAVPTSWIKQKTLVAKNIYQTIELFESNINSTYLVAWIDCYSKGKNLGRSLITLGEHAAVKELDFNYQKKLFNIEKKKKISIPMHLPTYLLNNLSVRFFNYIYFLNGNISKKNKIVDWDNFFYPLDKILNWNKIYGSRGFAQFQCVIPLHNSKKGITELLKCIANSNSSSFLAVLKRFGKQDSFFSFPMKGYSLALDFPINKRNLKLMNDLDKITLKYDGRFYLAKDSRMKKTIFQKSDNRIQNFKKYRKTKLKQIFSSIQSQRLGI